MSYPPPKTPLSNTITPSIRISTCEQVSADSLHCHHLQPPILLDKSDQGNNLQILTVSVQHNSECKYDEYLFNNNPTSHHHTNAMLFLCWHQQLWKRHGEARPDYCISFCQAIVRPPQPAMPLSWVLQHNGWPPESFTWNVPMKFIFTSIFGK